MPNPQHTPLCSYRYDPLDRLIGHSQSPMQMRQRFYCKSRLATEIEGAIGHSIFQHDDLLLAQQQHQDAAFDTTLLATDLQRSVLHTLKHNNLRQPIAHSPYGHRPAESGLSSLLGFNGERPDPLTGHYLLGNGYRAFNPVLMRFNSPDSWSPFGGGGLNSYAYCLGDPINDSDPNGHITFKTLALTISAFTKKIMPQAQPLGSRNFKTVETSTYITHTKYTSATGVSFTTTVPHSEPLDLGRPLSLRNSAAGLLDNQELKKLETLIDFGEGNIYPSLTETLQNNIEKLTYTTPDNINSVKIETYRAALKGHFPQIRIEEAMNALKNELDQPNNFLLRRAFPNMLTNLPLHPTLTIRR